MSDNSDRYSEEARRYDATYATFMQTLASNRQAHQRFRLFAPSDTPSYAASPASDSDMSDDSFEAGPYLARGPGKRLSSPDCSSSFDSDGAIPKEVNALVAQRTVPPAQVRRKDEKIIINSVGESRYVLLPDNKMRRYWDSFILVLIIYVAFVSVFVYSFFGVLGLDSPWFWMERFLDVAFGVDIIISFFAAYEKDGFWVKDLGLIRRRYLRSWFLFDALATFPWDTIALAVVTDKSVPHLFQLPRFIRLVRLFKLFRLLKIFQLQQKFTWIEIKFRLKYGYLRLAGLFGAVVFLSHLFACLFYYFGAINNPALGESWTTRGISDDLYGKYVTALYFSVYTITTIGYGDVVPVSTLERSYTILIMVLGAACFAFVISQVSNIFSELNASSAHNRMLMDSVIDLQKTRDLKDDLVFDIRRFFKREHLRQRVKTEGKLLDGMSRDLRVRVLQHIYGSHLENSRLLEGVPAGSKEDVYLHAQEVFARKDEKLFKRGDRADCFYVIIKGSVTVTEPGKLPVTLKDGSCFGEADLLFNRQRNDEAVCLTYTDLVKVPRSAVMEALGKEPETLKKLRHQEALILWEEAMWFVEQHIRYKRMASSLREKGERYVRSKIPHVASMLSSRMDSTKPPDTHDGPTVRPTEGKPKVDTVAGPSAETRASETQGEEKGRRIEELEQNLKNLQQQLNEVMKLMQAIRT